MANIGHDSKIALTFSVSLIVGAISATIYILSIAQKADAALDIASKVEREHKEQVKQINTILVTTERIETKLDFVINKRSQ